MTVVTFLTGWWILWLPIVVLLGLCWLFDRLSEPDDIDALIEWERRHE